MRKNYISKLNAETIGIPDKPLLLFSDNDYSIYWMGNIEDNAFRTNIYLIIDGEECIIVDPGSTMYFPKLFGLIEEMGLLSKVKGLILCHQDPDVAASMYDWLKFNPELKIITTPRTNVLIPHYGISDYDFYGVEEANGFKFSFLSGRSLKFIEAPFMHFPGAFATYDTVSKNLFSGDVCAAIDFDNTFIVSAFEEHKLKLDLFHIDYIASNIASRSFAKKLYNYDIENILPQHGAIIPGKFVPDAIKYLEELVCGLDLIYVDEN